VNPFQLAGKFNINPLTQTVLNEGAKLGIGLGNMHFSKDPVNKAASALFGLPYVSLPALGVTTINAGATAPGTLDEARRLGLFK
jgi:hypothetical protein